MPIFMKATKLKAKTETLVTEDFLSVPNNPQHIPFGCPLYKNWNAAF